MQLLLFPARLPVCLPACLPVSVCTGERGLSSLDKLGITLGPAVGRRM
jgi:hypothetical protein